MKKIEILSSSANFIRSNKIGIGATLLVITTLVAAIVSGANRTAEMEARASAERAANYATWATSLESSIDQDNCREIKTVTEHGRYITYAKKLKPEGLRALRNLTEWTADGYVKKHNWVEQVADLESKYKNEVAAITNKILKSRIEKIANADLTKGFNQKSWAFQDTFRLFAVSNCGLSKSFDRSIRTLASVTINASEIKSLAASKPWYPRGYKPVLIDANFAYKNHSGSCSYSFGSCATFKIISKISCPSGFYVETSSYNNGVIDDWGNDTLPALPAMQPAQIETDFIRSSGGGTWGFSKISCY